MLLPKSLLLLLLLLIAPAVPVAAAVRAASPPSPSRSGNLETKSDVGSLLLLLEEPKSKDMMAVSVSRDDEVR